MYNVIQLSSVPKGNVSDRFSLNIFNESVTNTDQLYTEAVFSNGKQTIMPLVGQIDKIKQTLDEAISKQENSNTDPKVKKDPNAFDPVAFWRSKLFKDLEDMIGKIFGFRNVEIHPFRERYITKSKEFESRVLNCLIYKSDRYPIDALVTDKGFYDKSRSLMLQIYMSLGLIRALTSEELLAVLLHEFGHSIDPALVDIQYIEVNILSKYLTDRKNAISRTEQKYLSKNQLDVNKPGLNIPVLVSKVSNSLEIVKSLFNKNGEKGIDKIRKIISADKSEFSRQNSIEAFADNFARMYGFGPQLVSGLQKMSKDMDSYSESRIKKEKKRQKFIISMIESMIKDVHKTDIHRVRALLKEYEEDLKDSNIPEEVKKQIREDMEELKKVLDGYMNNFSDYQNRINQAINEELIKKENQTSDTSKSVNESVEVDATIFESKKAYEKLIKAKESVTSSERAEFYKLFGKSLKCSLGKDKDGYYVYTHRARSKSYTSIDKIPQKDVDFVRSTS